MSQPPPYPGYGQQQPQGYGQPGGGYAQAPGGYPQTPGQQGGYPPVYDQPLGYGQSAGYPQAYSGYPRPPQQFTPIPQPPQRPAVIGMAACMTSTASLLFVCGLAFVWLVAAVGAESIDVNGPESGLYHMLHRFHLRLLNGLAWPLFLFPAGSFIAAFLLLGRSHWTRVVYTLIGVGALAWSIWWLRDDLVWSLPSAAYIAIACVIVWTPGATRWYGWRRPTAVMAGSGSPPQVR